jgi:hypothetical protein
MYTHDFVGLDGTIKQVKIIPFSALDGWDMQRKFIEFAASTDKDLRREYTFAVLAYAKVMTKDDREIPLTTGALIDNHLQTWQNVEGVFEAVLLANGIDPKTHADRPHYWQQAGAEMAIAFIAEATKLMGPAFEVTGKVFGKD